jgi:hypothetical protein
VRIVDDPLLYCALRPTERGLALDAPHLVASVYFGNAETTIGAGSRILPQFLHRVDVFLFADVVGFLSFNRQKTFGAREFGAYVAFVLGCQHTATAVILALHNEFARLRWTLVVHFSANTVVFHIKFVYFGAVFANLRHNFLQLHIGFRQLAVPQSALVVLRNLRNCTIRQYFFAMVFVIVFHE